MKKTKLIALTLVVAIMMMGAGYAAWTDTLEITGTVNTGQLDVCFVDLSNNFEVVPDAHMNGNVQYSAIDSELMNRAIITINDVYPGSKFDVNLKIKNNSTMPVKIDQASVQQVIGAWSSLGDNVTCEMKLNNGVIINPLSEAIPVNEALNIKFEVTVPLNLNETQLPENHTYTATIHPVFEQFNDIN